MSRQRNLLAWVILASWVFIGCFQVICVPDAGAVWLAVSNNNDSGPGSLRFNVLQANANAGTDTIYFVLAYPDTIKNALAAVDPWGEDGPLIVTESLYVHGPGSDKLFLIDDYLWVNGNGDLNQGMPGDPGNTLLNNSGFCFQVGEFDQDNSGIDFKLSGVTISSSGGIRSHAGTSVELDDTHFHNVYSVGHSFNSPILECEESVEIRNSLFTNCSAYSAGATAIVATGDLVMDNTKFKYNHASGPIVHTTSWLIPAQPINVDIRNCRFEDIGNAFRVDTEQTSAAVAISNSVFYESASSDRPCIISVNADLKINNVTVDWYGIPSTDATYNASHLIMVNGNLWMYNSVFGAPHISADPEKPRMLLSNTNVAANENNFVDDGSMPGTLTGDPGFQGGWLEPNPWIPAEGSALIDAGNNQYAVYNDASPITHDILGNARIQGNAVEIGAAETVWEAVAAFSSSLAAEVTDDGIVVRWNVSHIEDVLAFNLYRQAGGQPDLIASMLPVDQSEFRDRDVDPGRSYTYSLGVVLKSGDEMVVEEAETSTPSVRLQLGQNHPNPFNPSTTIDFVLAENGQVELAIYDTRGRLVTVLESGVRSAGKHSIVWQGTDSSGRKVGSGTYHYVLKSDSGVLKRSMVLIK